MMLSNELESMWKEVVMAYYSGIFVGELRKAMKNFTQDS
jgi:hypothetical protein